MFLIRGVGGGDTKGQEVSKINYCVFNSSKNEANISVLVSKKALFIPIRVY